MRSPPPLAAAVAGALLLAAYVLPLYLPPATAPIEPIAADAGLWARVFPGVPGWWMGTRLFALGLGAGLLAWAGRGADLLGTVPDAPPLPAAPPAAAAEWLERAALGVSLLLLAGAALAGSLSREAQFILVGALALPALLLCLADRRDGRAGRARTRGEWWGWAAVALLVAGWLAWRIGAARHDPRAADLVDMWKNFGFFVDAAGSADTVVTQSSEVGVSNVYLLFVGLPLVGPGRIEPSFAWIQAMQGIWIALTAGGVAALARRIGGPAAMLPAVAALLWSPFMMSMAVCVAPFAIMTAMAAALLLLVCRVYERAARADLAALGALCGIAVPFPHLSLWAVAAALAVLPRLRQARPSRLVWATAVASGIAAALPAVVNLWNLSGMSELYIERRGVAVALEQLILGQRYFSHAEVAALWHAGARGLLDVPLAALFQPFAIPRSPVRLGGDVYFEPIAAALAAVGIAVCLLRVRGRGAAPALLAALALSLLPGAATSAFDRASLTRNLALPVLLPLFTVIGLFVAQRALRWRLPAPRLAALVTALIAASGVAIFDVVNPRIVASTWLSLVLGGLGDTPAADVVLLEHGNPRNDWLRVPLIARHLPPEPLAVTAYQNAGSLLADAGRADPTARLIFWSPSLQEQSDVQSAICGCWPRATLYTLHDPAGLSRAFGAELSGAAWQPALPSRQWTAAACPAAERPLPSCALLRAMAHDNRGQQLAEQRRLDEAIVQYREAIALAPTYAAAYNGLGVALAAQGALAEAIGHYREAIRLAPDLAPVHNNLAIALENVGQNDAALEHYREAVRLAPRDPLGRLNLGAVLSGRGQIDDAIVQFEQVVRQSPGLPEARLALAEAYAQRGRTAEAISLFRDTLRDRPGWAPAVAQLAWLLAAAPDAASRNPAEAVTLASELVRSSGGEDLSALRTLAVAYAADGRTEEAIATAQRALDRARGTGQADIARDLAQRLTDYRSARRASE